MVRAVVDAGQRHARRAQQRAQVRTQRVVLCLGVVAARDAGLVRHHHHQPVRAPQQLHRLHHAGQQPEILGAGA
jgi:hypothetical protein